MALLEHIADGEKLPVPLTRMGFWLWWGFPFWGVFFGLEVTLLNLALASAFLASGFFSLYPASLFFHPPSCKMGKSQNSMFWHLEHLWPQKNFKKFISISLYISIYISLSNFLYVTGIYLSIYIKQNIKGSTERLWSRKNIRITLCSKYNGNMSLIWMN